MSKFLDHASDVAFEHLEVVNGDINKLPEALQTVALIYSAQGIIDNGGFQYFFENDFPGNPPYTLFASAYRRIGAYEASNNLEKAIKLFPFDNPHLYCDKRNSYLDSLQDPNEIISLGDQLCGDSSIWEKLKQYILKNAKLFK